MRFHIGQKVICIDDNFHHKWSRVKYLPKRGIIYTVRDTLMFEYYDPPEIPAIFLKEIVNEHLWWMNKSGLWHGEMPFAERRFGPITERKTDISIFTNMLKEIEYVE